MSTDDAMAKAYARGLAIAAIAGALLLAGCSTPTVEPGQAPPQDEQGRYVISMTSDLTFEPARAQVPAGATVVWRNDSEATVHDVAGYKGDPIEEDREEFSSFDPPPAGLGRAIPPGGNFTYTFPEAGAWTIWCHTHHEEGMKGVVQVA